MATDLTFPDRSPAEHHKGLASQMGEAAVNWIADLGERVIDWVTGVGDITLFSLRLAQNVFK